MSAMSLDALRAAVYGAAYVALFDRLASTGHYDVEAPAFHAICDRHATWLASEAVRARRQAMKARRSSIPPPP